MNDIDRHWHGKVVDLLLEIRHFVTDKTEVHDPYLMSNEIVEFIDNKTKEFSK